ncbi:MAG: GYD domain-containing protein [Chloroflexi bacterium]|nr:GYD domain-containing protein [Chloroflexota bacterium]
MPTYVMLTNLTDEGRKTLKECPERIKDVNIKVEDMGANLLHQYALMGPYDFLNILEAPDNETMARIAVELGSRGTLQAMTLSAIPIDDFIRGLEKE